MKKNLQAVVCLSAVILSCASSRAVGAPSRETQSFNDNWLFARFGPMPDGSQTAEPGATARLFQISASSMESDKGNLAEFAADGDPTTRWCANGAALPQTLTINLGSARRIGKVAIRWEFDDGYRYTAEFSGDGKTWSETPGTAQYVRIRVTGTPDAKWASIREVHVFDAEGQEIKNEALQTASQPSEAAYNDSSWRKLNVPHDWAIEGPFRYDIEGNTGKLPWRGIGWYRKHFSVPAADAGRRVFVDFDGAMANAKVWCNGQYVGTWPYGYQAFRLELTPFLKLGAENVIAVRLDTTRWGSRWYPGAGIYRNVRLVKTAPVHVGQWGVWVTTEGKTAKVAVTVDNQGDTAAPVSVSATILGLNSLPVTADVSPIPAGGSTTSSLSLTAPDAKLWDLQTPNLYTARVTVAVGGTVVDTYDQPFGFRSFEFTPRDGFHLNGKRVPLYGTCNHHDLGALGAAVNYRALERQLEILKEMGDNALRTSHNPPAPELLELADRMGFVVMCEAFDCWEHGKTGNDYARLYPDWHVKDLQAMVHHFRNHPSIVLWSTGNEVAEQGSLNPAKHLRDIVHAEDPTRPVTAGVWDGAARSEFRFGVDVFGQNYGIGHYAALLKHPGNENKPFLSSESSSQISSRGEYFFGMRDSDFQVNSYDLQAVPWGCTPDAEFAALDKNPQYAGEFVWTGFDYLGEPTPYNNDMSNLLNVHDKDPAKLAAMKKELEELGRIRCPSRSSYFGIVDLAGFKKDRFYNYQARWRPELPMAHILPHWNWPERVGQATPVHVYTSGDEVELFLNGKSLGRRKKGEFEYRLRWEDVKYEPGELKAVAYKGGARWAEDVVKTAGAPAKLILSADRAEIKADGQDLTFVTVTIADKDGLLVPRTHNLVRFETEGVGDLIAVDNGDATSFEPFQASQRKAYNGLCLAIIRSRSTSGSITLKAVSEGLAPAQLVVRTTTP